MSVIIARKFATHRIGQDIGRVALQSGLWLRLSSTMIWASFVLDVVRVLIWPIVLIVFRSQILDLLSRMTRLTAGGVSMDFQKKVEDLEMQVGLIKMESIPVVSLEATTTAAAIATEASPEAQIRSNDYERFLGRSEEERYSYAGKIIGVWAQVEQQAAFLSKGLNVPLKGGRVRGDVPKVVDALVKKDLLPAEWVDIARNLHRMRNEFAHNPDMASVRTADSLMNSMSDLLNILNLMKGAYFAVDGTPDY